MSTRSAVGVVWVAASMLLVGCRAGEEPTPVRGEDPFANSTELQLMVLDEIDELITEHFVYADFGGVDWVSESALARHLIEGGLDDGEFEQAMSDLVAKLPDGTASFLGRAERIQAEFDSSNTYEGIGAFVAFRESPVPRVVLLSVIEGSPAEQAGLKAHDIVYAVNGDPITADEGLGVIDRVRGPSGSLVTLQVASPFEAPRQVDVRRGEVVAQDVLRGGFLEPGMLYLLVPVATDESLAQTMAGLLQSAIEQEQDVLGMVIDLRIASSGANWPLAEMLTLLGDGTMGHYFTRQGEQQVEVTGQNIGNSQTMPLAILVGPDTAGAPEVLAAALQANGRANVVGLPSAGNVLVFQRRNLADGSQLSFAESSFVTPDGRDLSLLGVTPDLHIDSDWDVVLPGQDPVLFEAIDLLVRGG